MLWLGVGRVPRSGEAGRHGTEVDSRLAIKPTLTVSRKETIWKKEAQILVLLDYGHLPGVRLLLILQC